MTMILKNATLVDEICDLCLQSADKMSWLVEPLTPGRAKAYVLQHALRNRLLSSVIRPAWVSRCPDQAVVMKTIAQMREELVMDDAINRPHTDLIFDLGRSIGLTEAELNATRPVPLVDAAFNIWENLARTRHWTIGWLSSSVGEYLITTLPMTNFRATRWKDSLGLDDAAVFFFSYHEKADEGHAGRDIWNPIARHVTSEEDRQDVLAGTVLALEALSLFYRGVADLGDKIDQQMAAARVAAE